MPAGEQWHHPVGNDLAHLGLCFKYSTDAADGTQPLKPSRANHECNHAEANVND